MNPVASGFSRTSPAGLKVDVTDERGRPLRSAGLGSWLARVAPPRARGTVAVALVGDARVRALNRQYRGKDYATDVLSFPSRQIPWMAEKRGRTPFSPRRTSKKGYVPFSTHPEPPAPSPYLGDIVIARGVARRQARAAGHGESQELRLLALHGLLHLLGYDHERDTGQMARIEKTLRKKGGLAEGLTERITRGGAPPSPRLRRVSQSSSPGERAEAEASRVKQ